jgi:hypothetical protein
MGVQMYNCLKMPQQSALTGVGGPRRALAEAASTLGADMMIVMMSDGELLDGMILKGCGFGEWRWISGCSCRMAPSIFGDESACRQLKTCLAVPVRGRSP